MNIIVTTGYPFTDIDSLACAIAYSELLSKSNVDSKVVLVGLMNSSITKTIKKWDVNYDKDLKINSEYGYVLVDISEPDYFPSFANLRNVIEVWDHRFGYRDFWKNKKVRIVIEEVGSCATLIWEEFKRLKLENKISKVSANLLYTAIFSNTLNFNASVTTERDIKAFEELKKYIELPENWIKIYYKESEEQVLANPDLSIKNDTKVIDVKKRNIKITISQIELWNSFEFVDKNKEIIKNVLSSFGNEEWFITAPSISEGKNYIYTENSKIKDLLLNLIEAKFEGDIGVTSKLWLRKEILKKMLI